MRLAFNRLCFLSRADSFYQTERVNVMLVEAWRLSNPLFKAKIVDYITSRQNRDGGYTFCQGAESNAQDTHHGLAVLHLLNSSPPNIEKTAAFLAETHLHSIYPIYHVAKASLLLGKSISGDLKQQAASIIGSNRFFGSTDSFSEVSSEFNVTYMALELANLLKIEVPADKVASWLLNFQNADGGFGTAGQSNLNSTYYTVASISLLKRNLKQPYDNLKFVRSCEKSHGGFTVIPINFMPYMEQTYYGVLTLDLMGQECRYPKQTTDWILKCQNRNGGFARSELGISTFADTYYAVSVLQRIGGLGGHL